MKGNHHYRDWLGLSGVLLNLANRQFPDPDHTSGVLISFTGEKPVVNRRLKGLGIDADSMVSKRIRMAVCCALVLVDDGRPRGHVQLEMGRGGTIGAVLG